MKKIIKFLLKRLFKNVYSILHNECKNHIYPNIVRCDYCKFNCPYYLHPGKVQIPSDESISNFVDSIIKNIKVKDLLRD